MLFLSFIGTCFGHYPVSYTHLDVYKRQTANTAYYIHKYRNVWVQVTKLSWTSHTTKHATNTTLYPHTHAQITIKNNTHAALQTKRKAKKIHLDNIINDLYYKQDTLNKTAYNLHVKLTQILHHIELENIIQHTRNNIETVSYTHLDVYKRQVSAC